MTNKEANDVPRWVLIHTQDYLEEFYKSVLQKIRDAAARCGYAIGVHGSMRRDLDLIAAPWVSEHSDKNDLAREIQKAACGLENSIYQWEKKPCGRFATAFAICSYEPKVISGGCIDLSVMSDAPADDFVLLKEEIEQLKEFRDGLIAHREKLRDERTPGS